MPVRDGPRDARRGDGRDGQGGRDGRPLPEGEALQTLSEVTTVALDKTGTLTEGRPSLTDLRLAPGAGLSEDDLLRLVAAAEAPSEHPVARALVAAAERLGALPAAAGFESISGMGVRAAVEGRRVEVGADRFMASLGLDVSPFADDAARMGDEAKTPLYAAVDGRLAAVLAVADAIRPTTLEAIRALHARGLRVAMVTGDNRRTAEAVGRALGIDDVLAEVLPADKAAAVTRLQAGGARVAFVGDGINDAPALAQADVGVAIGTGTDVAIESADVVLMAGDLRGIVAARALSEATLRTIRQNLFWAFAYNVVLIPVAAGALFPAFGVLLSPIFGAAAMGVSSLFVLGNALRLRRFHVPSAAARS